MDLPVQYMQYMQELLGEAYPDFTASFSCNPNHGLRVNNLKIGTDEINQYLDSNFERIPFVSNGFYIEDDSVRYSKSPFYNAGLFYLQEPSAMLPADRLPIEENDIVLDLCAAPGGKSTAILSKLNGTGLLLANDYSYSRAQALLKNLELFGGDNYMVCAEDPLKLSGIYQNVFDKIIVDAPCSGEGMFRKDPGLIKDWVSKGPSYYTPLQRSILDNAVKMLKGGGLLMYSTCTFSVSEDEDNVKYLLDKYPELSLVEIEKNYGIMPGFNDVFEAARVFPHKVKGEGHFLCMFKKANNDDFAVRHEKIKSTAELSKCNELLDFLKNLKIKIAVDRICILKDQVYYLPKEYEKIYEKSVRFLRTGLLLGELDKNNRFKPSTTLALSLKSNDFAYVLSLNRDDIRIQKYLRGETIFAENGETDIQKGFILICIEGFGIGFAKLADGKLKNLLGKGFINN